MGILVGVLVILMSLQLLIAPNLLERYDRLLPGKPSPGSKRRTGLGMIIFGIWVLIIVSRA